MKNNQDDYKWGMFYYNRDDMRIFVPKINRWRGWTINFANPFSYLVILGIIGLIVLLGMI